MNHLNVKYFYPVCDNHWRYVAFDFHEVCKGNKYEHLNILLEKVKDDLIDYNYFLGDPDGNAIFIQKGIFRTNCIDCLDRTNVVQVILQQRS